MTGSGYDVVVERDLVVRAPDGVALLTDVYHPVGIERGPTIVERSGYGRQLMAALADAYARAGYHYVLQTVRGIDGSGGECDVFAEPGDGGATAAWIAEQPWFDGNLGVNGASHMGFTAYALASTKPEHLKAMCVSVFGSDRRFAWFAGGSLAWELTLGWNVSQWRLAQSGASRTMEEVASSIGDTLAGFDDAFMHLPMGDAGRLMTGADIPLLDQILEHADPGDRFWDPIVFTPLLDDIEVPVCLVDNWHDYQLPRTIADHRILLARGAPHRLVLRPGAHAGEGTMDATAYLDIPLAWFDTYLRGETGRLPTPRVTYTVTGVDREIRDTSEWPPAHAPTRWYLQRNGGLAPSAPTVDAAPSEYHYDPADPTPSYGGIGLFSGGMVDNRELETRADVLVFTSDVLDDVLEVVGPVFAELVVSSTLDHTDFFVRVCDVHPDGSSWNVCDGLRRFRPADITRAGDGTFTARVALWDTAYRFGTGHRVRVQVSSGAHPVYVRNLGTGDPIATATAYKAADQEVFHDAAHPSAVVLPHRA
jgi:putative CocE/NonD family hydrolase